MGKRAMELKEINRMCPYYLRLSVTDECTFKCFYCQPNFKERVLSEKEKLSFNEMLFLVKTLLSFGVRHVRLTGGEPLLRKGLDGFSRDLFALSALDCLSMTTNGYYLSDFAQSLKNGGVGSINVSLDTLNQERFFRLTGIDGLTQVLEGINKAIDSGIEEVRLNVVLTRGFNDDEIIDFVDFGIKHNIDVRFIERFSTAHGCDSSASSFISTGSTLKILEEAYGQLEYMGSDISRGPAVYYKIRNVFPRVGFISSVTGDFCADCNRLRMTSDGKLYLCLHSDFCVDLKESLRSGDVGSLSSLIGEALFKKKMHNKHLCKRQFEMSSIGG